MSRIGKMPIQLPDKVTFQVTGDSVQVKGPKGELKRNLPPDVAVAVEGQEVRVSCIEESRRGRAMHGLARALLQNMVTGVSTGFTRVLEINGVGYRAEVKPGALGLALGYSHPIEIILPDGIEAKVEKNRIEKITKVSTGKGDSGS